MNAPSSPIILALDVPTPEEALQWVRQLHADVSIFKIGMQLFYRYGPEIVRRIQGEGGQVFLDLKLHDIPNTVAKACESLLPLEVALLTVHISGGPAMLEAAQRVVQGSPTRLLGITALTSLDESTMHAVFPTMSHTPSQWALHLASVAQQVGLYGIVCSAQENRCIRTQLGSGLCLVNPGIRPASADVQDQKRVCSPAEAMQAGSNYLVIGRPILQAADPKAMVRQILAEMGHAAGLPS